MGCDDEQFIQEILELSEDNKNPEAVRILKVYSGAEETERTERVLKCTGEARLSRDGEATYQVTYYVELDRDGDLFIGYEIGDRISPPTPTPSPTPTPMPTPEPTPTPTPEPTPTPQACLTAQEAEYFYELASELDETATSAQTLADRLSLLADDPSLLLDDAWRLQIGFLSLALRFQAELIILLDAPSSVSSVSNPAMEAARMVQAAVVYYTVGFNNRDLDTIAAGLVQLNLAISSTERVIRAIETYCEG